MWITIYVLYNINITPVLANSVLPDQIAIKDRYESGIGITVGQVIHAEGETIISHENEQHGFLAKNFMKLYTGDTLCTQLKSRISILLNDRSRIILGASTKLTLNRFHFNPAQRQRNAFIQLNKGKARFHVQKCQNYPQKSFKVKTQTSLISVYGSDFIIQTTLKRTEVTTLSDTVLSLISLAAPDAPPALLHDYMWSSINHGELPSDIERIGLEVIEALRFELPIETESISLRKPDFSKHHTHSNRKTHKYPSSKKKYSHQLDKKMPLFHTKSASNDQTKQQKTEPEMMNKNTQKQKVISLSTENAFSIYEKHTADQPERQQDLENISFIRMRNDVLIDPENISKDLVDPMPKFKTIIYSEINEDTDDQQLIIEAEQTDNMPLPYFPAKPKY
jgi:hypothetical protein